LNRYTYAKNNPMRYNDPTGHRACGQGMCLEGGGQLGGTGGPGAGSAGSAGQAALDMGVVIVFVTQAGAQVTDAVGDFVTAMTSGAGAAAPDGASVGGAGELAEAGAEEPVASDEPHPLKQRVDELHGLLDPRAARQRTTGAVEAVDKDGNEVTIIGSSRDRLSPKQRAALKPGEVEAPGSGHAEQTALDYAEQHGLTPRRVAASRPICEECAEAIERAGARPVSPLRGPR
jgi:hypothetical protein